MIKQKERDEARTYDYGKLILQLLKLGSNKKMKINIVLKLEMTSHEENLFYEQFKRDCEQKKKEKINADMEADYIPYHILLHANTVINNAHEMSQQEFYTHVESLDSAALSFILATNI